MCPCLVNPFSPFPSIVTTDLIFVPIFLPFPESHISGFVQSYNPLSVSGVPLLGQCFRESSMLLNITSACSLLGSIHVYGCTTICLSVNQLIDLDCFLVWAIVNKAYISIYICRSLQTFLPVCGLHFYMFSTILSKRKKFLIWMKPNLSIFYSLCFLL